MKFQVELDESLSPDSWDYLLYSTDTRRSFVLRLSISFVVTICDSPKSVQFFWYFPDGKSHLPKGLAS